MQRVVYLPAGMVVIATTAENIFVVLVVFAASDDVVVVATAQAIGVVFGAEMRGYGI